MPEDEMGVDLAPRETEKRELAQLAHEMNPYDREENRAGGIHKVGYNHRDMIETMLRSPGISQNELAARYGFTPGWVSRIISSDAFKVMYAKRREELGLGDAVIMQETEERLRAVVNSSLDKLVTKLETDVPVDGLVKVLDVAARALGYGAPKAAQVNLSASFVVALPEKAASSQAWADKYKEGMPIDQ